MSRDSRYRIFNFDGFQRCMSIMRLSTINTFVATIIVIDLVFEIHFGYFFPTAINIIVPDKNINHL